MAILRAHGLLVSHTQRVSLRLTFEAFWLLLLLGALLTGYAPNPAWAQVEPACTPPPSGMVSWWGGDNNALDMVGTNHGTLLFGATYAPGKAGQAFSLDGVDDYVDLGSSAAFDLTDFTLDAWVYIDSSTNTGERRLISRDDWTVQGGDGREYYILKSSSPGNCGASNRPYVEIDAGGIASICSPSDLATGWHYLAATRSGTTLKLYVDGAEVASTTAAGTGIISPDAPLVIGTINPTQNIENFIGLVDEVEIFNRALSAEEIAAIYNAGSAGKCQATDTTPDPITFTDLTGIALSTLQTSTAITVSGITGPAPISIVGGEYELNSSGTWTSSAGTVANTDTVRVRHTSAATNSTVVDTTLTIGGVSDTFTSTTLGTATLGVFRGTNWFLDLNGNEAWDGCGPDGCIFGWGMAGDLPVAGRW